MKARPVRGLVSQRPDNAQHGLNLVTDKGRKSRQATWAMRVAVVRQTFIEPRKVTAHGKRVITANEEARVGIGFRLLDSVRA